MCEPFLVSSHSDTQDSRGGVSRVGEGKEEERLTPHDGMWLNASRRAVSFTGSAAVVCHVTADNTMNTNEIPFIFFLRAKTLGKKTDRRTDKQAASCKVEAGLHERAPGHLRQPQRGLNLTCMAQHVPSPKLKGR